MGFGFWVLGPAQGSGVRVQGSGFSSMFSGFCRWQHHQELTLQIGSEFAHVGHLGKTSENGGFGFWVLGSGCWGLHRVQGLGFMGSGFSSMLFVCLKVFCRWQPHQELTWQTGSEFAMFGHLGKKTWKWRFWVWGVGIWVLGSAQGSGVRVQGSGFSSMCCFLLLFFFCSSGFLQVATTPGAHLANWQ